ncbi:TnsD family Tn7-like transposition protein [Bacillus cereus]|uniref:TnsD family Tn7-like transposition protein n=1 Tax=Bacillus TaxID=1386 RepID=UPI00207A64A7|nr:TnsD family Tn7-like transposition protein [Bacillus anthracis]MDA1818263.1 TnsD family Tn7-like transposition protein [Bacillus cereus]USL00865.1 TnsD family transposase [Bacillus anthracis]
MINYFPTPYKDELLYSIIARYHVHSNNLWHIPTIKELFNTDKQSIDIFSPNHWVTLIEKMNHFSEDINLEYFLKKHTIIPFVLPFQVENWLENIVRDLQGGKSRYKLVSFKGNDISKEHLYYCTECLKEQYEKYGEGYWNRIFQCPGVFVCIKHKIPLVKYPINMSKEKRHGFILPVEEDINRKYEIIEDRIFLHLLNLAQDIYYLFSNKFHPISPKLLFEKYKTLMEINNIAYPALERQKKLGEAISNNCSQEFLELLSLNFIKEDKSNWLRYFLGEASICHSHPIRHLLVMRALCGSSKTFFEKEHVFEPFGKGPWVCMNHLSDHYLQRDVKEVKVSLHSGNRRIQGDFICKCGFIYRLREWEQDPLEVVQFSNRIIERGEVWEENFKMLLNRNLSWGKLSELTGFSIPTLRKIVAEQKGERKKGISGKVVTEEEKRKKTANYKKIWKEQRESYPNYNRKKLIDMNRAVYGWLHKYDMQWLEENMPVSQKGRNIASKKEGMYNERDKQLLKEIKKIVKEWEEYEGRKGNLMRKSYYGITEMVTSIDRDKFQKNYPLTMEYVLTVIETVQEFQKRRVRHLLNTTFLDTRVTFSQLKDISGIKKFTKVNPELESYVKKMVEKHNRKIIL